MSQKKLLSVFVLFFVFIVSNVFAADVCTHWEGGISCEKGAVDNVSGVGLASLNGTTVTNAVSFTGNINAVNADINKLNIIGNLLFTNTTLRGFAQIIGNAALIDTKFLGGFQITGFMLVTNSSFETPIEITSPLITLKSSTTKNIVVHKSNNPNEQLYLQEHSIVNGDIVFESNTGTVFESDGSLVNGNVIGGTIVKK
ncbi:MAG: hypothetical protein M1561_03980 [Gammaproteobacteria bacterium]|nr:hypothetical protein [Gammaproteobacteria bacterium]